MKHIRVSLSKIKALYVMFKTRIVFASQNCQVARRRRRSSSTQGKLIRYPLSAVTVKMPFEC